MDYDTPLTSKNAMDNFRQKIGRKKTKLILKKIIKKSELKTNKSNQIKNPIINKEPDRQEDDFIIILTNYMKIQNELFLKELAQYKELSQTDTELLVKDYLKIGYYTPTFSLFG